MKRFLLCVFLGMALLAAAPPPVPVIFDTDIGNDIDDVLALAMLHGLESRGVVKLLAVTVTKDHELAGPAVRVLNRFYGREGIPVGVVKNGATREEGKYNRAMGAKPEPMPDAVPVLRAALEKAADGSVVVIQVGFSTNLARLLESPGGRELVKKKVRLLSIMAGHFTDAKFAEYNVKEDIASAQKVFSEWPGPVVFSGFEIGMRIKYPAASIEKDFSYADPHPVVLGYRAYMKMPYDRETWDLTSVLAGVLPDAGYFRLSEEGRVVVEGKGTTRFVPQAGGGSRYLLLEEAQIARIREAMIWLASQPPKGRMVD